MASAISAQAITPSSVDQAIFFADQFSGADMGAKINAAAAACSGGNSCKVMIPAGFYVEATPIVLPQSVTLEGVGPESSWLQYTGTGALATLSGAWAQIKNVVLQCTAACTYQVNMTGGSNVADNLLVQGGTSATTFFGIHGPNNRISNIVGSNISGTLYECDNAVNNFINNSQTFGVSANTTAIVVDMNSGCNNLQIIGLQHSYAGLHGLWMRNTLTGGSPTGLFFSNFVTDQSAGGTQWLFDSTLGSAADNFVHIVNGFAGSAGSTGTTVTTAAAIGIDIEGGRNLSFDNVNIIDSAASGVLIGNAQVANVKITNSFINNNNRNNTASTNGITVSAAATGLNFTGNTVGNLTGDNAGNQKLGIAITSSTATNAVVQGNDLNNNATGPFSNSMTGTFNVSGNLPASVNTVDAATVNTNTYPAAAGFTPGGVPFFSSTTAEGSSALLAHFGVMYGGGAGAAPATTAADTTTTHALFATAGAPAFRALAVSDLPATYGARVATTNLTAQAANISSTTVFTTPATNGYYNVCLEQVITQAATSGGNTGVLNINYTSAVNNHAVFPSIPTGFPGNTGASVFTSNGGCMTIFAQASTAIQYSVGSYNAGTGTPQQFALNITVFSENANGL